MENVKETPLPKVSKKASDIQAFLQKSLKWMSSNDNNQKTKLAYTIFQFLETNPDVVSMTSTNQGAKFNLVGIDDILKKCNKDREDALVSGCDSLKISQFSDRPSIVTEYLYSKNGYMDFLKAVKDIDEESKKEVHNFMNRELFITPLHCKEVPDHKILPTNILEVFKGFVVNPEWDRNGILRDLK